jgi:toxin-antitoxin system PIN domain toxin
MAAYPPANAAMRLTAGEAPLAPWGLTGSTVVGDLPDINVWLALAVQEHPFHAAAQAYWVSTQARYAGTPQAFLWFCRTTLLGLVRLLCQTKAVGAGALTIDAAWQLYQQYRTLPQIGLLPDPPACDNHITRLLQAHSPLPPRLWTDAYLAAAAQSANLRLVSFDRDFERFALPQCLILSPSS